MPGAWQPLWHRPEAGICLGSSGAFLVLEALYRKTRVDAGPDLRANGYDEGLFQFHLLY